MSFPPRFAMEITSRSPIKMLSLDGGGVRGLSSLLLLRGLMERLMVKKAITLRTSIRPCDYFDLIIGTGTGGISALFLGRMQMTIDEAIEEYLRLVKTVFEPPTSNPFALHIWRENSILDGQALERGIGDVVERILGDRNTKMKDSSTNVPSPCRTAVLAAAGANADAPPHVFRSYRSRQPDCHFSIVEVARATMATAGVFKPVSLGSPPMQFIDAGHSGYNNPVDVGLTEAAELWQGRDVECLVSIGTGLQQVVSVGEGWDQVAKTCMMIVQSCELIHDRIFHLREQAKLPYFRLTVSRGLESAEVMEWKEAQVEKLTGTTQSYMQWAEVRKQLDDCASILSGETLAQVHLESTNTEQHSKKFLHHNPAPTIFHGREDYVNAVVTIICDQNQAFLCILGPGGIGKTAIACAILHDLRLESKFGNHRFFVSCDGISSIAFLMDNLCRAFGLEHFSSDKKNDVLKFLKDTYATKPLLLMLDNFESVWEAATSDSEALLAALSNVTRMSLVLTMRGAEKPANVKWTKPFLPVVEPLSPQAAYDTFMDICGKEDEKLGELLQELDYIPLAVTLMAHLGQVDMPSHLLQRWRNEKTQLLSRKQGRLKNLDVSIHVSLESKRMQSCSDALALLSLIVLLPNGVFAGDLKSMAPTIEASDWAAQTLCQVGLAYKNSFQTLYVLSPIRAYIAENYPPKQELLDSLENFHFEKARQGAKNLGQEGQQDFMKTLQKYEGNMEEVICKALKKNKYSGYNDDEKLTREVQAALDWTSYLRWYRPRETIIELALQVTRGKEKYQQQHIKCLQSMGEIQSKLNNYQQAQHVLSQAQGMFGTIGDQHGAAQCLQRLGKIQCKLNNHQQAQGMLSTAQAMFGAIGDQHGIAQCLRSLGDIQSKLNNHKLAQHLLSTAQARFEAIGDQYGAAQCLRSLGDLQYMLDNHDQAQELLSKAQTLFEVIGHQHGAAQCLQSLGNIHSKWNNYQQAESMLSKAQGLFEAIGNKHRAAQCLMSLGDIQYMLNNYQKAKDMLCPVQAMFEAIGDEIGAAQCLQCLGDIEYMLDNYQEAQDMLSTAKAKFEAIGDQIGMAQCLRSLGDIQCMLEKHVQAQEMLSKAQTMFETIGNQHGAAQCLQSLGRIQFMLHNHQQAQGMLSTALARFEHIGDQLGAVQCLRSLGMIQFVLNNYQQAQDMLSTAHVRCEVIGDKLGVALCLQCMGDIQYTLKNYQQAQDMISTALAIFDDIGDKYGTSQCLQSQEKIQLMLNDYEQAQNMAATEHTKFESIENQLGTAQCLRSVEKIQSILNNYQEAQDMLCRALTKFEEIKGHIGAAQTSWSQECIHNIPVDYLEAQGMLSMAKAKFDSIGNKIWKNSVPP